ncbi:Flp family type IVb pilin [Nioella sp. MMSF_3534]|uniref:Flp family type IVb pilin n=1 Tax=Nioella sp. MMSF_3534 TaxID=3046720 RepID=UPI0035326786
MTLRTEFWYDESGAVTVDMTVLAAGVVGLGIATMSVVSSGVEDLSGDINAELSSNNWNMFSNGRVSVGSFDFSGGNAPGWLGGSVRNMGGELGELLVLGPGEATGFLVEVAEGATNAIMEFDLVAGDSLDNSAQWGTDTATISLNGVPVAVALASGNSMTFDIPQLDGTTVEATVEVASVALGGNGGWNDSVASVRVTVDEPTSDIQFELQSNANQGIGDEFWGLDNFDATTTGGPGF